MQSEMNHYDSAADHIRRSSTPTSDPTRALREPIRQSYLGWLSAIRSAPSPQRVLDYCAGLGQHTLTLQNEHPRADVVGIDISAKSLQVGIASAARLAAGKKRPTFLQMDAHRLDFPDAHFDLVSDFGSLSSLRFDLAMAEIVRVLRPGGLFVAVETFGHNPLTNLKRRFNVARGTRTTWASQHILDMEQVSEMRKLFGDFRVEYHVFFSLLLGGLPFKSETLSSALGRFDDWFLNRLGFLRKYAFKVVVCARKRP